MWRRIFVIVRPFGRRRNRALHPAPNTGASSGILAEVLRFAAGVANIAARTSPAANGEVKEHDELVEAQRTDVKSNTLLNLYTTNGGARNGEKRTNREARMLNSRFRIGGR